MAEHMEKPQTDCGRRCSKCFIIPQRVILALMGFLGIVNCYTTRNCIALAITVLVPRKNVTVKNTTYCPMDEELLNPSKGDTAAAIYDWSEGLQGFILGSFYIGYFFTHLPGGILTDKYGGKWVLTLGMALTALASIFSPLAIYAGGPYALVAARIIMGFGQGVVFPALGGMLAAWVPAKERGKLGALVMGGGILGSIVNNSTSGLILSAFPWPVVFIFFGFIVLVWCLLFMILCFSYPTTHPYIKEKEVAYLFGEMGHLGRSNKPPVPWCAILKNKAMFALIMAQIGHDWGLFVIVTDLPKYFADVLGIAVRNNGALTSLPFVLFWIVSIISGFLGDCLITKNYMSVTNVRKMMTVIAAWGPGLFMVLASYAGCNRKIVVCLFIICMGTMGPYFTGMKLSPLDMSPNYAGTLMAISNGIGAFAGFIAPWSVGLMTPNATMAEWRWVFWVAFGLLFITAVIYIIWGSGEVQPFDTPEPKAEKEKK